MWDLIICGKNECVYKHFFPILTPSHTAWHFRKQSLTCSENLYSLPLCFCNQEVQLTSKCVSLSGLYLSCFPLILTSRFILNHKQDSFFSASFLMHNDVLCCSIKFNWSCFFLYELKPCHIIARAAQHVQYDAMSEIMQDEMIWKHWLGVRRQDIIS